MEPNAPTDQAANQAVEHSTPVATTGQSARVCVLQCSGDTSSINGHSCADCKEMREIEAGLAAAEKLVSDLKQRRTALQSAVVARNDPITGILPPEVSARIFELYVEVHTQDNRHYDVQELDEVCADVPLRLGAICRRWREIAWSSPRLWTMLKVDLVTEGHTHGPELVQLWFERTGSLPVSVRLEQHYRRGRRGYLTDASKVSAQSVMDVLNRFSSKLYNLDLQRVPFDIASLFRNRTKESPTPTLLRYLCVGDFCEDEDLIGSSTEYEMCLFHHYNPPPSPHNLSLHSSIPPNRINILWSNLIELSLENVSRAIVFEIIRLCAFNLVHLSLETINDFDQDRDWDPSLTIHLPELLSLTFTNMETSEGVAEALFDTIRFPCLESLKYYGDALEHTMPVRSMVTCIRSSACHLEELAINEPDVVDVGELVPLLREVLTLKTLDLSLGPSFSLDYLLWEMNGRFRRKDEPMLLPALEYLELTAYPTFEWSEFTQIWLTGELAATKDSVLIPRIYPERKKLGARMTLQNDGGDIHFLPAEDVLDVISIIPELNNNGISIHWVSDIIPTLDSDAPPLRMSNLVEASYLHHFPTDSAPQFLSFYNKAKAVVIF